jgi:uncharacterized metal-binding protein
MEIEYYKNLYTETDLKTMRLAEEARLPGKNRIEEIKNFARLSGIRRIGIANCIGLQKEADMLRKTLEGEFEVFVVDCKTGKIPSSVLFNDQTRGVSCNPAGQAEYLHENNTELNISFGLCMGHDIIFNKKSIAPVTTLIVKDREHKHNPYKEFENNF